MALISYVALGVGVLLGTGGIPDQATKRTVERIRVIATLLWIGARHNHQS